MPNYDLKRIAGSASFYLERAVRLERMAQELQREIIPEYQVNGKEIPLIAGSLKIAVKALQASANNQWRLALMQLETPDEAQTPVMPPKPAAVDSVPPIMPPASAGAEQGTSVA